MRKCTGSVEQLSRLVVLHGIGHFGWFHVYQIRLLTGQSCFCKNELVSEVRSILVRLTYCTFRHKIWNRPFIRFGCKFWSHLRVYVSCWGTQFCFIGVRPSSSSRLWKTNMHMFIYLFICVCARAFVRLCVCWGVRHRLSDVTVFGDLMLSNFWQKSSNVWE
jgi:hypothetical protein